jgi:hypothetical protein
MSSGRMTTPLEGFSHFLPEYLLGRPLAFLLGLRSRLYPLAFRFGLPLVKRCIEIPFVI